MRERNRPTKPEEEPLPGQKQVRRDLAPATKSSNPSFSLTLARRFLHNKTIPRNFGSGSVAIVRDGGQPKFGEYSRRLTPSGPSILESTDPV
jgi:hypothetical protein